MVIESGGMRVVLEAKVGGSEPSPKQLIKYASESKMWGSFRHRVIVALTQVKLQLATVEKVRSELSKQRIPIRFRPVQWHEIVGLVLGQKLDDESALTRFLFDEFIRYLRSDYRMGYYDAEVLVQGVNALNREIFENGWMYVSALKSKKAPLYFAPYFTGQGDGGGISMIARVMDSEVAVLTDDHNIVEPPSEEYSGKWSYGLTKIRRRAKKAEKEGKAWGPVRLFYLDRPIIFRTEPLSKRDSKKPDWKLSKKIPDMIPNGFHLDFDDLLKS